MNTLKQFVPVETPATPTAGGAAGVEGSATAEDAAAAGGDSNGPSAADLRASPATTPARVSGTVPIQRQVSAAVSSTPKAQKPLTTPAMQRTTSHTTSHAN